MTSKERKDFAQKVWLACLEETQKAFCGIDPISFEDWYRDRYVKKINKDDRV